MGRLAADDLHPEARLRRLSVAREAVFIGQAQELDQLGDGFQPQLLHPAHPMGRRCGKRGIKDAVLLARPAGAADQKEGSTTYND